MSWLAHILATTVFDYGIVWIWSTFEDEVQRWVGF